MWYFMKILKVLTFLEIFRNFENFEIFRNFENFEIFRNFLKSYEIFEIYENLRKKFSSEIHVFRSYQFSLLMNVSLFTSVVCYMYYQNGLRRKHGKCSLCNKWWNSFMNQRLNHLVLYEKCNCIRIMSLNTYNKNVDIIWHYCIISQITLHCFWNRLISSHKYEERRIEVYDK